MSGSYGNGPTTVLDHFRMKFRLLAHHSNMRPELVVLNCFAQGYFFIALRWPRQAQKRNHLVALRPTKIY
jgi:hypothetical protein